MSELLVKYFVVCFLNQKLCHNPHIYCDMYKVIIFFIQEEMKDIAEHISINSDFIFIFVHSMTVWEIKTEWWLHIFQQCSVQACLKNCQ